MLKAIRKWLAAKRQMNESRQNEAGYLWARTELASGVAVAKVETYAHGWETNHPFDRGVLRACAEYEYEANPPA